MKKYTSIWVILAITLSITVTSSVEAKDKKSGGKGGGKSDPPSTPPQPQPDPIPAPTPSISETNLVTSIDVPSRTITVLFAGGNTNTFRLDPSLKVTVNGAPSSIENVKAGMKIEANTAPNDPKTLVVVTLEDIKSNSTINADKGADKMEKKTTEDVKTTEKTKTTEDTNTTEEAKAAEDAESK